MAVRIEYTNNLNTKDGIKCVVYGRSGVGKTRACVTAPFPIILSAEKGLRSIDKFAVPYLDCSTWAGLNDAFTWALNSNETKKYHTICLDSLSEIAEVILNREMEGKVDPRKAYLKTQNQINAVMRKFRDLPQKHVYFIAKELILTETSGMQTIRRHLPNMPSDKLQQAVPYFFDGVFNMFVGTTTTGQKFEAFRTSANAEYEGKDRTGTLAEIEPVNLNYIFNKMMKKG